TLASASFDTTVLLWDATGLTAKRQQAKPLSVENLNRLWGDLAGNDASRAYDAIATLALAPKQAVPFLQERVKPAAAADSERVVRLIADLDSPRFAVREKANQELEKLGEAAAHVIRKNLQGQASPEVRRRLETL